MEKFNAFLLKMEMVVGSILLGVSFLIVTAGIIARYAFNSPLAGAEELSIFLFVWMGFLAIGYGIGAGGHIQIDSLLDRLPVRLGYIVRIATNAILLVMFLVCLEPSITTLKLLKVTPALRLPEPIIYSIIPFSFALYCIHLSINIASLVKALRR